MLISYTLSIDTMNANRDHLNHPHILQSLPLGSVYRLDYDPSRFSSRCEEAETGFGLRGAKASFIISKNSFRNYQRTFMSTAEKPKTVGGAENLSPKPANA